MIDKQSSQPRLGDPREIAAELLELRSLLDRYSTNELGNYPALSLTRQALERRVTLLQEALQAAETGTLNFRIDGDPVIGNSIKADFVARILTNLQESLAAVGQALQVGATARGVIQHEIREATGLRLAGTFAGSFGLILEGPPQVEELPLLDIMGRAPSVFEQAVLSLLDILEASNNEDYEQAITSKISPLGPRALGHIKSLSQTIEESAASTELVWRRPAAEPRRAIFARSGAARLVAALASIERTERVVKIRGRLVGASMISGRFELETESGTVLRGRVDAPLLELVPARFNHECHVTLNVTISRSTIAGEESEDYTLVGLE
jgi:hypothetical protein